MFEKIDKNADEMRDVIEYVHLNYARGMILLFYNRWSTNCFFFWTEQPRFEADHGLGVIISHVSGDLGEMSR